MEKNYYHLFKTAMMIKTICHLHNIRHQYSDPNDYRNQLEMEFDDPKTTRLQIKYLRKLGFKVYPVEANEKAYFKLYRLRKKIDLVFNLSEGIYGLDRELQLPAMLEMLQIPYTGSGPLTQGFALNKAKAKEILMAYGIPTTHFQLVNNVNFDLDKKLKFPLIVKPVAQGSSAGITNNSVVFNEKNLRNQIKKVIENFRQPALIEPFLSGREFSVAMIGNPPIILPIIEPNHKLLPKNYLPFDSYEVKWFFEEQGNNDYLQCPAKIEKKLENKIKKICYQVWKRLEVRDWCRIDIKCDEKNNPYFLEINSPPGIIPPEVSLTSYFPLAARAYGWDYATLLKKIIETAEKRIYKR